MGWEEAVSIREVYLVIFLYSSATAQRNSRGTCSWRSREEKNQACKLSTFTQSSYQTECVDIECELTN